MKNYICNADSLYEHFSSLLGTNDKIAFEIKRFVNLSSYSTFHVGGECPLMLLPTNSESLTLIISYLNEKHIRYLILGNGSNILFDDEGYDGVIVLLGKSFGKIELIDEDVIRAYAGAQLVTVCNTALSESLSGLEFAYGIPGTVGGAVFMNAGAYGGEMKDVVLSVTAIDDNGCLHTYKADELDMGYRHSRFTDSGEVVIYADFKLYKDEKLDIQNRMNDFMTRRKEKQPLSFPSAGSTFKRPEGQFAGKLIQDCGLRGASVGGAQVSEKHCGFIINKGGATSADVKSLIKKVQDTVLSQTGFMLECEVRIIPFRE